jgi:hypothetical protein
MAGPPVPPPQTLPDAPEDIIRSVAKAQGVDPDFALSIAQTESGLNPHVGPSPKGALGMMQLMPATAARHKVNPNDPYENALGGVMELRDLQDKYGGDLEMMTRRYNGRGPETTDYARKVLGEYERRKGLAPGTLTSQINPNDPGTGPRTVGTPPPAPADGAAAPASATSRFLGGVWQNVNPWEMAKGVASAVTPEVVGKALGVEGTGPVNFAKHALQAQVDQAKQAADLYHQGRYSEAIGHGAAAALPLIGPAAAQAGETIGSGDVAGGLGQATGILAPLVVPGAIKAGAKATQVLPGAVREGVASAAEDAAASRMESVMSPKVGPNKTRFGNKAATVSADIAAEPGLDAWTRGGLHAKVIAATDQAAADLDAVHDARLKARTFTTQPLIDDLLAKRRELTMQPLQGNKMSSLPISVGGEHATTWTVPGGPLGHEVVPAPNAARVAVIDNAIHELQQHGPYSRYDQLRIMRQAYDGPAKIKYNPSVTQDFLAQSGKASGAADVTGTLRDYLVKQEPETGPANEHYHMMKSAQDALDAAAETERVRPGVGRMIMTRLMGVIAGGQAAGLPGAVAGATAAPVVEGILHGGFTTKIQTARALSQVAEALRSGNVEGGLSLLQQLKRSALIQGAVHANDQVGQPPPSRDDQAAGPPPPPAGITATLTSNPRR